MKAWAVTIKGCREFDHIAWGETRGKVCHAEVLASKDAGFNYTYADFKITRAPWCDTTIEQDKHAFATSQSGQKRGEK